MPVINLTGTANATIWVRVWGFEGSTGTFTICVFNYISFNYVRPDFLFDPAAGESVDELENAIQVPDDSEVQPGIHISPNPVSDQLNVEVQQTDISRVVGFRMLDLSGQSVIDQKVEPVVDKAFRTGVDVSGLVPGMYLLQVQTTTGMMVEKVMVIR